jgi:hypothetical protein
MKCSVTGTGYEYWRTRKLVLDFRKDTGRSQKCDGHLEQPLHIDYFLFVCQKQDDVIIRLEHRVPGRKKQFIATDNGTNDRTLGKRQFPDRTADNPGRRTVTVDDQLDGLGGAPSQGVHGNNIAAPYMGQ